MKLLCRADARLIPLADGSVHCVVTSPPYWGLRDYGVRGQLGLEKTPEEYVAKMVAVFREVRRVLRDDGTLWLNLGDSYAARGNSGGDTGFCKLEASAVKANGFRMPPPGFKHKDLVGIPWMVAFALRADGWFLRSDIIWAKPNPMPESVRDRPTKAHEYLFLLAKSERYYYDDVAIREPDKGLDHARSVLAGQPSLEPTGGLMAEHKGIRTTEGRNGNGRNRRSVWTVATQPYSGAHFATFPEKLVEPCILAGTSAKGCCPECGAPWERVVEENGGRDWKADRMKPKGIPGELQGDGPYKRGQSMEPLNDTIQRTTTGWRPTCDHGKEPTPCHVLDPFAGTATTVRVANRLGRKGVGLDISAAYLRLAGARTSGVQMEMA